MTNEQKYFTIIIIKVNFVLIACFFTTNCKAKHFILGRILFMEFIKKMKKREFIEMGLKTLIAFFACFIAIVLMCGMIYSIGIKSYMK